MKIPAGLLALALLGAPAQAQITYDMSKTTCAEYLAMDADSSREFAAWMSGWFNQRSGSTSINLEGFRSNVASVRSWCASNAKASIMESLRISAANAKPGAGGPTTINVSQITCGGFLDADVDTQALISAWAGGWFMSTKNLTNIDIRYVKRNLEVVGKHCRTHRSEPLMTAIQNNWR
jgi:acid stress chaperone HdeB